MFSTVESEEHKPDTWDELFKFANKSWSQIDEFDDAEMSRFEREEQERRQLDNILQQCREKLDKSNNNKQNDDNPGRHTNGRKSDHDDIPSGRRINSRKSDLGTIDGANNNADNSTDLELDLHDNTNLHDITAMRYWMLMETM